MQAELPNEIKKYLHENEQVLWWSKPDQRILSDEEKRTFFGTYLFIFLLTLLFVMIFGPTQGFAQLMIMSFLYATFISLVAWIGYGAYLINSKKNTWFVVTDQRVMKVSSLDSPYNIIENDLDNLRYFESRHNKSKGGNLYLGKYRNIFRFQYFDYCSQRRKANTLILNNYNALWDILLKKGPIQTFDYLYFYDLTDPETPAQIIRERTSAKEYIDPKRKKYRAE